MSICTSKRANMNDIYLVRNQMTGRRKRPETKSQPASAQAERRVPINDYVNLQVNLICHTSRSEINVLQWQPSFPLLFFILFQHRCLRKDPL